MIHVFGHKNVKSRDKNLKFSMVAVSKKFSNIGIFRFLMFEKVDFMLLFSKIYIFANVGVKNSNF